MRLNLVVQGFAPQDEAWAFAAMKDGVLLIGQLILDSRGQGGISSQLSAQEYRDIQVLFVVRERNSDIEIPLAGTTGRSGRVDWNVIRTLVVQALHPAVEEEPVQEPEPETAAENEKIEEGKTEEAPQKVEERETEREAEDLYDLAAEEEPFAVAERRLRTPLPVEKRVELPALLRNAYWPQQLWPLHDLFERFDEVKPFEGQKDCAYIRIPLDGKYGTVEYYLVGARVADGWVTEVGYLIPGSREKNVGFAGCVWEDGYWQSWQSAQDAEE